MLPLDLFEHIMSLLSEDTQTLARLIRANRALFGIGLKHLYRDIVVDTDDHERSRNRKIEHGHVTKDNYKSFFIR